ncbi:2-oxoglutarate dehydrogenase [uncultured Mediterranean phage uvDeep-CGR0-AD1-C123]|nr:2-oxoglutarate dehydrogenase [uncultured Mediterranean phage uvDeep-CGR0-AD1-C123]
MAQYDDLIKLGLLNAGDRRNAGLMGLFDLGSQIAARSAPRFTPGGPPINLSRSMAVYQNALQNSMAQRALVKKLEDEKKQRDFFGAKPMDPVAAREMALMRGRQHAEEESWRPSGAVNVETAEHGEELLPDDFKYHDEQRAMEVAPNYLEAAKKATTIPSHLSFLDPAKAKALMGLGQISPAAGISAYGSMLARKSDVLSPEAEAQKMRLKRSLDKPYSQLAKLKYDLGRGFIDKATYEQGVSKLLHPPRKWSATKSVFSRKNPGEYVGEYMFDTSTSKSYVKKGSGPKIPFDPEIHIPQNRSLLTKQMLNVSGMHKLASNLTEHENAMGQVVKYMGDLKVTNTGIKRISDSLTTTFKTLFTTGRLTRKQLALAASKGRIQALLGRFRIEVVGPGVMTEFDAARVIEALGGFPGSTQNLEVAEKLLKEILGRKINTYKTDLTNYNRQVKLFYSGHGFKKREIFKAPSGIRKSDPLGILKQ